MKYVLLALCLLLPAVAGAEDDTISRECGRFCRSPQSATTGYTISGPGWSQRCDCEQIHAQEKKAETCSPAHLLSLIEEAEKFVTDRAFFRICKNNVCRERREMALDLRDVLRACR